MKNYLVGKGVQAKGTLIKARNKKAALRKYREHRREVLKMVDYRSDNVLYRQVEELKTPTS